MVKNNIQKKNQRAARTVRPKPTRQPGGTLVSASSAVVMAVVKADAYGHGMGPVARAARQQGVEWLGVALPTEALALRAIICQAPKLKARCLLQTCVEAALGTRGGWGDG